MAIRRNEHGHEYGDRMRYFIDGVEVTEQDAKDAELAGTAQVMQGASGNVPERLRQPNETREDWFNPWMEFETIDGAPVNQWEVTEPDEVYMTDEDYIRRADEEEAMR
jgi:hypothetical protein